METTHKKNLGRARMVKNIAKNPTPIGAAKAALGEAKNLKKSISGKYLNPFIDWLFGIALIFALLKDILDLVWIGSLPAIGTALTLFASFIIFMVLFIVQSSGKSRLVKGFLKKLGVVAGGTFIEVIFGLNFLPIETTTLIIVFYMTLRERAMTDQQQKENKAKQAQNIPYADNYHNKNNQLKKAA